MATVIFTALAGFVLAASVDVADVSAHQDGCHRWHSCPSDSGSYVCGDTGYTSECGALPESDSTDPEPLYDDDSSYDESEPGELSAPAEPPPAPRIDVNAEKRQRAQRKLAAAQARLNEALAGLVGARGAVAQLAPRYHHTRRVAGRLAGKADKARARALAAGEAMASERRAAMSDVTAARAAYRTQRSRWSHDRRSAEALAIALLLLASLLAFWWRAVRVVNLVRQVGWTGKRYAKATIGFLAIVGVAVAITLSLVGLPAGGAVTVLILGLAILAWIAWRSTRPGARFALRRVVTTSVLAAVVAIFGLATLGSGLSTAEPSAPEIEQSQLSLARVGITPYENPTTEVTGLRQTAVKLERFARVAADRADTAAAAYKAAAAEVTSLEAKEDAARASIDDLNERIGKLAPKYDVAASSDTSGLCDPNYSGECLDPNSTDYDCDGGTGDGPDYTGPVEVVGDDPYDLDRDGDGFACDW